MYENPVGIWKYLYDPTKCSLVEMAKFTTMDALLSFALFLVVSSVNAGSDAPFIVAHKKATLSRLNPGAEKLSVSINIYNQGSAYAITSFSILPLHLPLIFRSTGFDVHLLAAYDVSLTDDGWSPELFSIISGNTSTSWERLDVGAVLSHSFELESTVKSVFYGTPAVITFRVPTKAALQEAYSTSILPLEILSDKPRASAFGLRLLGKYGNLVSVISIVVLFVYLLITPPKSNPSKGSRKRR
ncbi:hypothetical protein L2E82_44583 [Cichorium intybus]|uniref:Uncharacterized protein n=1 Tax=Cichorium intybus TaxID=13427 RepID=A0ACB8ZQQ9_CICIN|nr:hypothetical protein L2E82_44583 [Cichorium intybus]